MLEIDRVVLGEHIPDSRLDRRQTDIAWLAAVEEKLVIQPTLDLSPVMEPDLIYYVNPEKKWR